MKQNILLLITCMFISQTMPPLLALDITVGILTVFQDTDMNDDWTISGDGGVKIDPGVTLYTNGYNITINASTEIEFDVGGTLEIENGSIVTINANAELHNKALAMVKLLDGTIIINTDGRYYNYGVSITRVTGGAFQVSGGACDNGSNVGNLTAYFDVTGGTLQISTGGTFRNGYNTLGNLMITGGTFILDGGTLVNTFNDKQGSLSISDCDFTLDGGEINKPGTGAVGLIEIYGANLDKAANDTTPLVSSGVMTLPEGETSFTIPEGKTFTIGSNSGLVSHRKVEGRGGFVNQSPNSWDIYDAAYTYSAVDNGDGSGAGTINISFPGKLYVLGGTVTNGHANSVINVNSGGSLYNYYGTVDLETGGADSLDVKAGGKFYNARGNNPGAATLSNGCMFMDATEVHLDGGLELDGTWTITEKAVIRGYGNEIRFSTTYGAIVIDGAQASLLLDDVIISGVEENKIRATDTNSTLSIGNVVWVQDNSFSYTEGNIFVSGEWVIAGDGTTFEYATEQTSTIGSNGSIRCLGTAFEYNASNANGINMVDDSSVIHLDRGALLATQALTLANGTLITTGSSSFVGTALLDLQNVAGINSDSATITIGNVIL